MGHHTSWSVMANVRAGWLDRIRQRSSLAGQQAHQSIRPTTLATAVQACAVHSGKLVNNLDRRRERLAEALRQLLAGYARALSDPDAAAAAGQRGGWAKNYPELLDALLQAGSRALACRSSVELDLALLISDAVLTERVHSRAGWRLRAQALEAQGDDAGAIEAHERYIARCPVGSGGITAQVAAHVAGLRESADRLTEILRLLQDECPGSGAHLDRSPTELWAEGLALCEEGDWEQAEPRLVATLVTMVDRNRPSTQVSATLDDFFDLYVEGREGRLPASRALLGQYADYRRLRGHGPASDPTLGGTRVISLADFRNLIAGKSICLVANSQRVGTSSMGAQIDSYDLVVRFNSYRIDPQATGKRTDIHATIHKHPFNWREKVQIRLVFGGLDGQWRQSIRHFLVPGAQRCLNDDSLRWPVRNLGGISDREWSSLPTSGFNMVWLLDFLDVNPRIDLVGFDFYDSGAYRLQGAMALPITSVHDYLREKEWVMARARAVTEMRIALR